MGTYLALCLCSLSPILLCSLVIPVIPGMGHTSGLCPRCSSCLESPPLLAALLIPPRGHIKAMSLPPGIHASPPRPPVCLQTSRLPLPCPYDVATTGLFPSGLGVLMGRGVICWTLECSMPGTRLERVWGWAVGL